MKVVVSVAEAGGCKEAARRLNVVQSALSGTVRVLERELGTPLFDRIKHRVSLTPAGEPFLPAARDLPGRRTDTGSGRRRAGAAARGGQGRHDAKGLGRAP